jgi:nicotinic acid mononucleotide adenylyltransferase
MLESLPLWHKIIELLDECNISIINRGGFDRPNFDKLARKFNREIIEKLRQNQIETPLIEISSTEIRQKLFNDEDAGQYLHPEVLKYIKTRRLYIEND